MSSSSTTVKSPGISPEFVPPPAEAPPPSSRRFARMAEPSAASTPAEPSRTEPDKISPAPPSPTFSLRTFVLGTLALGAAFTALKFAGAFLATLAMLGFLVLLCSAGLGFFFDRRDLRPFWGGILLLGSAYLLANVVYHDDFVAMLGVEDGLKELRLYLKSYEVGQEVSAYSGQFIQIEGTVVQDALTQVQVSYTVNGTENKIWINKSALTVDEEDLQAFLRLAHGLFGMALALIGGFVSLVFARRRREEVAAMRTTALPAAAIVSEGAAAVPAGERTLRVPVPYAVAGAVILLLLLWMGYARTGEMREQVQSNESSLTEQNNALQELQEEVKGLTDKVGNLETAVEQQNAVLESNEDAKTP